MDLETGESMGLSETGPWYGPVSLERYLLADLERHVLLRNTLVHAMGLGDANAEFLEPIAELGCGQVLSIGESSSVE